MAEDNGGEQDALVALLRHVSCAPGGVVALLDAEATILFASQQMEALLGYRDQALVATDVRRLLAGEVAVFSGTLPSSPSTIEHVELVHTSGVVIAAELSLVPSSGLGVPAWVMTIRSQAATADQEQLLRRELVLEQYCHSLSTDLVNASTNAEIATRLERACAELGELTDAHTVSLALERPAQEALENIGRWVHPDYVDIGGHTGPARSDGPQWREAVLTREVVIDDVTKPPYNQHHVLSRIRDLSAFLTVPFLTGSQRGVLVLTRRSEPHHWRLFDIQLARTVGPILAAALHRSHIEQLWKLTYELGPVGFSIRTIEGQLVDCNQQYREMWGLGTELTGDADLFDRVHPDDVPVLRAALAELNSDDPDTARVSYDLRVELADGTHTHLSMTTTEVEVPGQSDRLRLTAVQQRI